MQERLAGGPAGPLLPDRPGRVLVVDDDPAVTDVVRRYLVRDGHAVECAHDGYEALRRAAGEPPDLVVLDLVLPGMDGLEVCRRLRARWPVRVVMLTVLGSDTDRLAGFEAGADDYVTKPFSPRELALRVRSVLRRASSRPLPGNPSSGVIADGDLVADLSAHEVRSGGQLIQLTVREYGLLVFFMRNPRQAFTREQLLAAVWGWTSGDAPTVAAVAGCGLMPPSICGRWLASGSPRSGWQRECSNTWSTSATGLRGQHGAEPRAGTKPAPSRISTCTSPARPP